MSSTTFAPRFLPSSVPSSESALPAAAFPAEGWEGLEHGPYSLSAPAWNAFAAAAQLAVDRWPAELWGYATPLDVRDPMRRVCVAVRQSLDGETPEFGDAESLLPLRPPLDALRRCFLEQVSENYALLGMDAMLRVLGAIEDAQRALDENAAQRFAERFSGPDALHLVVEVAHDMRSPLGSILFLAERLRKGQSGPVDAVQERQLGLIYSAAFGLSTLASDVMELARGGNRLLGGQAMAFSVGEIFGSVRAILLPMAEEKRLDLRFVGLEGDWRVGHAAALNRVILNLATNALKFTNEGHVEVAARPTGRSRVEFSVTDTGRGIPPKVLSTLYDAFRRRATGETYAFSSAGLGLSICQKLIQSMGGELRVDTELERGTRFSFDIELASAGRM